MSYYFIVSINIHIFSSDQIREPKKANLDEQNNTIFMTGTCNSIILFLINVAMGKTVGTLFTSSKLLRNIIGDASSELDDQAANIKQADTVNMEDRPNVENMQGETQRKERDRMSLQLIHGMRQSLGEDYFQLFDYLTNHSTGKDYLQLFDYSVDMLLEFGGKHVNFCYFDPRSIVYF